jgi:hypothetical protein
MSTSLGSRGATAPSWALLLLLALLLQSSSTSFHAVQGIPMDYYPGFEAQAGSGDGIVPERLEPSADPRPEGGARSPFGHIGHFGHAFRSAIAALVPPPSQQQARNVAVVPGPTEPRHHPADIIDSGWWSNAMTEITPAAPQPSSDPSREWSLSYWIASRLPSRQRQPPQLPGMPNLSQYVQDYLHLPLTATIPEIKAAHRRVMLAKHPDKIPGLHEASRKVIRQATDLAALLLVHYKRWLEICERYPDQASRALHLKRGSLSEAELNAVSTKSAAWFALYEAKMAYYADWLRTEVEYVDKIAGPDAQWHAWARESGDLLRAFTDEYARNPKHSRPPAEKARLLELHDLQTARATQLQAWETERREFVGRLKESMMSGPYRAYLGVADEPLSFAELEARVEARVKAEEAGDVR